MDELVQASYHALMHPPQTRDKGFKRQVVFRLDPTESALLDQAATIHGSIQTALVAALHALDKQTDENPPAPAAARTEFEAAEGTQASRATPPRQPDPATAPDANATPVAPTEELTVRAAATFLGLTPATVRNHIRSGRLPGRYDGQRWLTTRAAVNTY